MKAPKKIKVEIKDKFFFLTEKELITLFHQIKPKYDNAILGKIATRPG